MTHKLVFDLKEDDDIYWCAADIGWVTGPLVHRLRTARQRRDQRHLRRHAGLPRQGSLVGDRRALQGDDSLHRADRDPHVHEVGRRSIPPKHDLSSLRLLGIASANRSIPKRGCGIANRSAAIAAGRRHVVADGDRRHHDLAAARRDHDAAGLGLPPRVDDRARGCRRCARDTTSTLRD